LLYTHKPTQFAPRFASPRSSQHYHELLRAQSFKHKSVIKGVVIIDLEGVTFGQLGGEAMKVVKSLIGCDSDNYPDTLGKLYIINAPGIFNFIWR